MFKITESNYEYYKKVYRMVWKYQADLANVDPDSEYSPIKVLSEWEQRSKSLARSGLKEGLRDSLTELLCLPMNLKEELNNQLIKEGLASLNNLFVEIKDIPIKVLKRGKIKNLDEYYIIKEVLADIAYNISSPDREKLDKILFDFENDAAKRKRNG